MTRFFTIILAFCTTISFAQKNEKIPSSILKSPNDLALYLTKDASSKKQKADTIYSWLTNNIDYDYEKSSSGDPFFYEDAKNVLKSGLATCTGYSNTLKEMLNTVGIPSEIVYGYVHDELVDSMTVPLECSHAWIAIMLDKQWYLADPTWDAGYIGNIKTDKEEKFKERWEKHNDKFDKAEAAIAKKKESNPSKEDYYEKKETKCKVKRTKAADKIRTKERNAKDFTGEHGFVKKPSKTWYMVSADSFLVSHLPGNPMWQLREEPISIKNFAAIKMKGNTVKSIGGDYYEENFDYAQSIRKYRRLDFLERLKWNAEDALSYNPVNYQMLSQNYYNWLQLMSDKDFQEEAEDKHKVDDFRELLVEVDSLKTYAKHAKKNSKTAYKYTNRSYNKMYKQELSNRKSFEKMISKQKEKNEKSIEDIDDHIDKLESNFKNLSKKKAKLKGSSAVRMLQEDKEKVSTLTDSLNHILNRFDQGTVLWEKAMDSTYLQDVYNGIWQTLHLLDIKSYYLEVKNYATEEYIREIDSLMDIELTELNALYKDSIPIEMLSKNMYSDIKLLNSFLSYADSELEEINKEKELVNIGKIKSQYRSEVLARTNDYLDMSERAYGHCKWMKANLKDFEKLWDQAESDVQDQEKLIEDRKEFIFDVLESKRTKDELFYELISDSCKDWKTEFKER